ncbi:hypothetical protein KSP40_PGU003247 [Platanthera guangdongensis]|uniref:Uncharacterized protein n=1 Tax=Platanthera guangdongensis TaxID=2320717 RepID=A0ABR2N2K0_9ASPA
MCVNDKTPVWYGNVERLEVPKIFDNCFLIPIHGLKQNFGNCWKEMFSIIIGSDEASHGKPSPDM